MSADLLFNQARRLNCEFLRSVLLGLWSEEGDDLKVVFYWKSGLIRESGRPLFQFKGVGSEFGRKK